MGPSEIAAAAAIVAAGAVVQGFLGFGFGIVAMSGLTMADDLLHAAGVVNVAGLALTSSLTLRMWRLVRWRQVSRIVPGILAGVVLGVSALRALDREILVRVLGATIVAVAAWNLRRPSLHTRDTPFWDLGVGFVSGLLGGAFNTGGPPLVAHLYRRGEEPEVLKATVQATFLCIGLTRLPIATAGGLMSPTIWRDGLVAAPLALLASALGVALARRVPPERFRRDGWIALGAVGVVLLTVA